MLLLITFFSICIDYFFLSPYEHPSHAEKEYEVLVVLTYFFFCSQTVDCEPGSEDDESLREMVELAAQRLYDALSPVY